MIHALNAYLLALSFYIRKSCKSDWQANNTVHPPLPVRWYFTFRTWASEESLEIFKRFPVQLPICTLWSPPPPPLKILMPLSQALVKNWYRCGQHAFPPALRKGPMWQKINLSKVSKPFPLRIPLDVLIAAPEIVYRCELISQRFSFEDSIIIA